MHHLSILQRAALALILLAPAPAATAETVADMLRTLESEGFVVTDIGRTFLGRIRIEAVSDGYVREVILSRSTGEIKQDAIFRQRAPSDLVSVSGHQSTAIDGQSAPN